MSAVISSPIKFSHSIPNTSPKVGFVSLGCPKALTDSELILTQLNAEGYHELARAGLLEPTLEQGPRGRAVTWSHPAFAYRHIFARSDRELVCADLAATR